MSLGLARHGIRAGSRRRTIGIIGTPPDQFPTGAPVDLASTAKYFIDSVSGLDTNTGLSTSQAWKTLAKLLASGTLAAGDQVALKCGSTFREAFPMSWSGTSGSPIIFGCYGTGTLPKVKGSLAYSGQTWTVYSGSVYSAPATSMPSGNTVVYLDETTVLVKKTSAAAIVAPGQYFADTTNNLLYVWMPDSSNPTGHTFEVTGSVSLICNTGSRHDLTFQDMMIMHGSGNNSGLFSASASGVGITVQRVRSGCHQGVAIFVGSPGMLVTDCVAWNCWDGLEYPTSNAAGSAITISTANATGSRITKCKVTGNYYGIRCLSSATNVTIDHNFVYLNHVNGIDNNGGAAPIYIYNNTVWHRPTALSGHGIDIQGGDGYISKNNIVFSDYTGTNTNVELFTIAAGTTANISEDYNLGYLAPGCTASYGKVSTTSYATASLYYAAVNAAYATMNTHSINGSDPLFNNMASGDFTLKTGSPAIDAGVAITGVTTGYLGAAPDLGALEAA